RHERRRHHPRERQQRRHGEHAERRVERDRPDPPHGTDAPNARRAAICSPVTTRITAKSTKATDAAKPRVHQRNPSSYISSTIESVASAGPPCVMTYGSAKSWR